MMRGGGSGCSKDGHCHHSSSELYTFDKSNSIFQEAKSLMPGGVNSPVRAFSGVEGDPIVFDRVKGAYAWDVDGNKYIDYILSWGPAILGHANDNVLAAVKATLEKGTSFGAPGELENILSKLVIEAVPSIEMVRFTNSGTEACMGMLRLARAYTGKEKVIKFDGCYHGHDNSFLVKAGSGVATLGLPDSPGVPSAATADTLVATYNDLSSVEKLLKQNQGEVAAIILEPVVGNSGFIAPDKEFLHGLRRLSNEYNTLLVFDEVMTGFRVAYGGAQEYYGVTPDLTTLGKIIGLLKNLALDFLENLISNKTVIVLLIVGGGLPVGAYGGRRDIMEMVAPSGPVYQAGTLSGNPLAMAAGIQTLSMLKTPGTYERLSSLSSRLVKGIIQAGKDTGHDVCGGHVGGMFGFFFSQGPIRCFSDAKKQDVKKFSRWHRLMLERGVYLAPSAYEAGFMSTAHTEADIDRTIAIAREVMTLL
eukprot:CAMPEP_0114473480 /NCGR_PEP_ID=MMETSP0104-20121206/13002_1 /TAXON_ID=37642 ORGANISM="Paraphysomonas imperforata, Strain PA2" /NCGR_SAMPLE_ID=MMETSP0104 /ASSEMBLY_ACC=CAM_ASM_000202 /LENGTH=475 /DNA_ID=CAMNT_0001647663 /DNA_START=199 /DNA_END=1629 /DNA_ORIENTATION=-